MEGKDGGKGWREMMEGKDGGKGLSRKDGGKYGNVEEKERPGFGSRSRCWLGRYGSVRC